MGKLSLCSWQRSPDALRAMDLEGSSLYQLLSVTCAWAGAAAARLHVTQMDQSPCVLRALERTAHSALGFYELVLLARPRSPHPPLSAVSACSSLLFLLNSLLTSSHFSNQMQKVSSGGNLDGCAKREPRRWTQGRNFPPIKGSLSRWWRPHRVENMQGGERRGWSSYIPTRRGSEWPIHLTKISGRDCF